VLHRLAWPSGYIEAEEIHTPARDYLLNDTAPLPTGGYRLTEMPAGAPAADQQFDRIDDAIAAARIALAEATTHTVHHKTLVVVFDARRRILWAAATDGWETDYRAGSSPEMG
jgi:hypothetical protein